MCNTRFLSIFDDSFFQSWRVLWPIWAPLIWYRQHVNAFKLKGRYEFETTCVPCRKAKAGRTLWWAKGTWVFILMSSHASEVFFVDYQKKKTEFLSWRWNYDDQFLQRTSLKKKIQRMDYLRWRVSFSN